MTTSTGTVDAGVGQVGALHVHDARVLSQGAEQLTEAGVDGEDAGRAGVEQRLREPARRRAAVERDATAHVDVEPTERERPACRDRAAP